MAFSINKAYLVGNATRDAEIKYTPAGNAVCTFGIATNRSVKNGEEWEDVPTFHNVVVFGKLAEYVARQVSKGDKVTLTGRINNRSYEAKDGTTRYISEIVAEDVIPHEHKSAEYGETRQTATTTKEDVDKEFPDKEEELVDDTEQKMDEDVDPDDIPF